MGRAASVSTGRADRQATDVILAPAAHNGVQVAVLQPMPPLTTDEYAALKNDISMRGVVVPVVIDQYGRLLDGHHRRRVATELGIACPSEIQHVSDDAEAWDLAVTLNATRRHLSREQRRDLIRAELRRRPDDSDRAVARRVGCSPSTVGAVRHELSNLDTTPADEPSLSEVEQVTLAGCERIIEDGIADLSQLRLGGPKGRLLTRDEALFVVYLWALHLDEQPDERMVADATLDGGYLRLYCGGDDGGCERCSRAVDGCSA